MPSKEIKALRQAGQLDAALQLATAEMEADPNNIWPKRNISWVYYDYIKQSCEPASFDDFISWLQKIQELQLPPEEVMLFDNLAWQIGKMCFGLIKNADPNNTFHFIQLFEIIKTIHFSRPSEAYSFLFKALHKGLKDHDSYIPFADWWNFEYFRPEDYQKEKLPNGREIMSVAEQGYIAYAKHMLPKQMPSGERIFDREKADAFIPKLEHISEAYPQFQYPAYFLAKLLSAEGDQEHMLQALLPFARKKRNDFWVWDVLADAFPNDPEKVFACYCKALTCHSPEEMLINLRQRMAALLISRNLFNEAKTEIELLVKAREDHDFRIPAQVQEWQKSEWYEQATGNKSNIPFYKQFIHTAEDILFSDTPEVPVIVEFVNQDKKMLNFIASETKFGYLKFDRFLKNVQVGETLFVRFQGGSQGEMHQVYTLRKGDVPDMKRKFLKHVEGPIRIPEGKNFGFLNDIYIHSTFISKYKLSNSSFIRGDAINGFNSNKGKWTWRLYKIEI